jgi:hypothetical protein
MWAGAGAAIVVIVAVVALVLVLRSGGGPAAVAVQITVEEITNRVETERPREAAQPATAFSPAEIGQDLLPGDGVKTFVESEARVDIRVQEFLRIIRTTPDTIWRLGQFGVDQDTIIELNHGKIFILDEGIASDSEPLRIVTPAGTASPRGTWMSVEYDKDTDEAEVDCFRGECELENRFGKKIMKDEQKSKSTKDKEPSDPVFLDEKEKKEFLDLPEVKKKEVRIPTPVVVPPTLTPTPDPTPTEQPPDTPTPEPTDTPEPVREEVIVPTATPVVIPTATPVVIPTDTPPPTDTPVPTDTPEPMPERLDIQRQETPRDTTGDEEPEPTSTPEPVPTPTFTPEPPPTNTPEPTPTATPEPTPTNTPEPTPTNTPEPTPTSTPEPTSTPAAQPLGERQTTVAPHVFAGSASIGGQPAPDGMEVTAWVEGFSEPVGEGVVSLGSYNLKVFQFGTTSFSGSTITFKIGESAASETGTWQSFGADVVNLTVEG